MQTLSPDRILRVGLGFWAAKALLSAVELGLFTELGRGPRSGPQLRRALALGGRALPDLPDALVALGFLEREGNDADAVYVNTRESAHFLDRNSPAYIGALLEIANARLYGAWGGLTEALRGGHAAPDGTAAPEDEAAQRARVVEAMRTACARHAQVLAERVDLSAHRTLADIGGGSGELALALAGLHRHLHCTSWDSPRATALAQQRFIASGLGERVQARVLDFLRDPLPQADVIVMSLLLQHANLECKLELIRKAHAALPERGCLIAIEVLIDDEHRRHAGALLMSLNSLVECGEGFNFSAADFDGWCRGAGFQRTEVLPLAGPVSAAVAFK